MSLYRKYRPQNFCDAVGQNHVKITLEQEIISGRLAHAYIFCGPRGVGKTTLARLLAKSLNCEKRKDGDSEPCGKCPSCLLASSGGSIDVIEIDAASHTGVDNVRENIIASSRVATFGAKYKIFIIDEAHMLSTAAFNALLKVLEEPPTKVIFILCTTEIHKVPATIISRCQRFDFKKISVADIVGKLEKISKIEGIKISKKTLEDIARYSGGHMRDAESVLGQLMSFAGHEISEEEAGLVIPRGSLVEATNLLELLINKNAAAAVKLVNEMSENGFDLKIFTSNFLEIARAAMIAKISPSSSSSLASEWGESLGTKIIELTKQSDADRFAFFLREFMDAQLKLKDAFIPTLPLELSIVRVCSSSSNFSETIIPAAPVAPSNNSKPTPREVKVDIAPSIETPVAPTVPLANINIQTIKDGWGNFIEKTKKYNHSLSFILNTSGPKELRGNELVLAVKYKFHKDRLTDHNIAEILEKSLVEAYGANLRVAVDIDENVDFCYAKPSAKIETVFEAPIIETAEVKQEEIKQATSNTNPDMISSLLKNFGGRVVE